MKRTLAAILAALTVTAALLFAQRSQTVVTAAAEPYSALRLHILADSDGDEDQAAKLAVRDAVLAVFRRAAEQQGASSLPQAKEVLKTLGKELQSAAENVLSERGMDYGVQLVLGEFDFPDRVYGDTLYPAGRYNALRMILGEGQGHNWWCVMYPPLCIIDSPSSPAEYNEDGTLQFKSFFSELLDRIFGRGNE